MTLEQEGVIKYQLNHVHAALDNTILIPKINATRTLLHRLKLIGQDDNRYDGYGFGNISLRYKTDGESFIISGTQTGEKTVLTADDYCLVTSAMLKMNQIYSTGLCNPSSEALTHASVYLQSTKIHAVIHVHCPEIWHHTHALNLAHTAKEIAYGTPEMATAVTQLFKTESWQQNTVFSLLGHEDGIISFGETLLQATNALINQLSLAIAIEQG